MILATVALVSAGCINAAKGLVGFEDPEDNAAPSLSLQIAAERDQPSPTSVGRLVYISATAGTVLSVSVENGSFKLGDVHGAAVEKACVRSPDNTILPVVVRPADASGSTLSVVLYGKSSAEDPGIRVIDAGEVDECARLGPRSDGGQGDDRDDETLSPLVARVRFIPGVTASPATDGGDGDAG